MKFVEKTGKNIEVATTDALIELGATTDEVTIEVIEKGSKGFFGIGAKAAKVRVTVKEIKDEFDFLNDEVIVQKSPKVAETAAEAPVEEKVEKQKQLKPLKKEKVVIKEEKITKTEPNQEAKAVQETKAAPEVTEVKEEIKEKPPVNVDEAVTRAQTFLTNVLKEMNIDASFEIKVKDKRINMNIIGDKMGLVIGKRGETLDSLQYLVNIAINKGQEGYIKVMLDTENYRARREETLRKVALKFAKKATEAKRPVALEPMNPYDRRIIHSVLQNSKFVKTHSEGREPFRKVVISPIYYKKNNKREV